MARLDRGAGDDELHRLTAGLVADEADRHHDGDEEPLAAAALEVIPGLDDTARDREAPPLRAVLGRWGATPLAVLFTLNLVDELDRAAFVVLAPNIKDAFDLSDAAIGLLNGLGGVLVVTAALPIAVVADRRNRTVLAGLGGILWSAFVVLTGVARGTFMLGVARTLSGLGKATVEPVHGSLLADYYPVEARGRVYATHSLATPLGAVLGMLLAGGIAAAFGWRWAFIALAPLSAAAGIAALRLREPRRGGQERGAATPDDDVDAGGTSLQVPLATAMRRLLEIRTLRSVFFCIGVLGFGLVASPTLLSLYLEEHWGQREVARAVILGSAGLGAVVGAPIGGLVADRLFRHNPSWPLFLFGVTLAAYSAVTAAALYLPALPLVVAVLVLATMAIGAASAPLRQVVAATSPPALRSLSFAMLGLYIFVFGGLFGGVLFGAISDATSPRMAITTLVVPGVIAAVLAATGSRHVPGDIANVVADLREAERAAARRADDTRNLLEVRGLDFSYGPVQVLFDVNLDVPEGEIVALLGTNGAGKSTLLRAITGLDHPTRGSIRFDGDDITYLEAEQLLGLGIAQMPGGKAVFPGLTVLENLKVGAFSFRKETARVEQEIAQVEAWFPVLAERRHQLASTLSGGEQQMLALGKAFLTHPRLFCIDELSLGLAPQVVGALLEIVREMHRQGTTIVIVEQSLNVALTLATTAVFMEKGQVRFVGPARELLERPDLARSVFLEGAGR